MPIGDHTVYITLHYIKILSALQSLYGSGKKSENEWVFSLDLKDDSDEGCDDDVTSGGRLFHVFATATEKAWSSMVRRRVGGTVVAVRLAKN